jgi:hypothetical protein
MRIQSSNTRFALALACCLLVLGGCAATAPAVRTSYDKSVDFSQYHSFGFASPLGTDRNGYQTAVSLDLKNAARRELEGLGLRFDAGEPQLLVNFNARLSDKLRVTNTPTSAVSMSLGMGMGSGYYGYRSGIYANWPLYREETNVSSYTEGTLNIDVADAARKQLVWEGVVIGKVTPQTLDNLQPAIDAAVKAAFAKYPTAAPAAAK